MTTNEPNAPTQQDGAHERKFVGENRDSLAFYLMVAPTDTPIDHILAAYRSDTAAQEIDWSGYGGQSDE